MKWVSLCHLGAEQAVCDELQEASLMATSHQGYVVFEADKKQAANFLYRTQTTTRLLAYICEGNYQDLDVSAAHDFIDEQESFKVEVDVLASGPQEETSMELAGKYGAQISRDVDLDDPDKTVFVQAASTCVAGIDVAGDLSKRYYRIFSNSRSMKGTLVASILRLSEVNGLLLDPFANTGEVCIEHALRQTNTSPLKYRKFEQYALIDASEWDESLVKESEYEIHCYDDHLANLRSCKKNAKLAGVQNSIVFSKTEPEWMDVKFDEDELSVIATIPPPVTKKSPSSDHLEELCYQAEFVLKNKGRLVVACLTPETALELAVHAKKYEMKRISEYVVYSGQLAVQVVEYGL